MNKFLENMDELSAFLCNVSNRDSLTSNEREQLLDLAEHISFCLTHDDV